MSGRHLFIRIWGFCRSGVKAMKQTQKTWVKKDLHLTFVHFKLLRVPQTQTVNYDDYDENEPKTKWTEPCLWTVFDPGL